MHLMTLCRTLLLMCLFYCFEFCYCIYIGCQICVDGLHGCILNIFNKRFEICFVILCFTLNNVLWYILQVCCSIFSSLLSHSKRIWHWSLYSIYLCENKVVIFFAICLFAAYIWNYENNFIINGPMVVVVILSTCMYFHGGAI